MTIFASSNLVVRPLRQDDLPGFHALQSNPRVMRFVTADVADEAANRVDLETCIACYSKPDIDFWVWAIDRKSDLEFVGTCAVVKDQDGDHEIGYRLLESEWGRGYGQEICSALIDYCIDQRQLSSLVARVNPRNVASVKILDASRLTIETPLSSDFDSDRIYRWRADANEV